MASIFTFDPDPPRVSSPWSTPRASTPRQQVPGDDGTHLRLADDVGDVYDGSCGENTLGLTRLEAEPQEGPTEYKLHLLLRPRRAFLSSTTGNRVSGSISRTLPTSAASAPSRTVSESLLARPAPPPASSSQSRQSRLEQLTTQLLWRLQQSAPHHSSSYNNAVVPLFPSASDLTVPARVGPVIPGLEESNGALYEIGVADDGTFIGLAEDEMEESINTLRAMAASLGCTVSVLRMVDVGKCEWQDGKSSRAGRLWVAEAYVKPNTYDEVKRNQSEEVSVGATAKIADTTDLGQGNTTKQLRVSLTGATMSGKSSLLGSLTTATLDNGKGKSRLSLLKHRHEIASGMTSSVTQELIGYRSATATDASSDIHVVNYAAAHVSSWIDVHAASRSGRLVFFSDSAGHPRFRRTTVRGLIGWAPHWTFLCIPADNAEDTTGMTGSTPPPQEVLGMPSVNVDLSEANLDLCLKLDLPLVIVITKLDLASKAGLRSCLSKVLSTLKSAGRRPMIIPDSAASGSLDLSTISDIDIRCVRAAADAALLDAIGTVPIILTSAIKGTGIAKVHALLHELPISEPADDGHSKQCGTIFHVEEIYTGGRVIAKNNQSITVLSGILQRGRLSIGDELLLGPYALDSPPSSDAEAAQSRPPIPTSRSFPGAMPGRGFLADRANIAGGHEWRKVRVTSVRNLRLPVRTLVAGQAGTVGISPVDSTALNSSLSRVRKGMVLASGSPRACRVFEAEFARSDVEDLSIRSGVVVYTASVRASAKIIAGAVVEDSNDGPGGASSTAVDADSSTDDDDGFGFGFDGDDNDASVITSRPATPQHSRLLVTFQFIASREYVEIGAKVLIMPGGGPGLYIGSERGEKGMASLEGFVGRIVGVT